MGFFITNYHVRTESLAAVREGLAGLVKARAYVSPPKDGWVTIYDEGSDRQSGKVIRRFASGLSKNLSAAVIACLVHDSDFLAYWLFDRGELLDEFNSAPDFFAPTDPETRGRLQGNPEALLPLCPPGTTREQILSVLHPAGGPPLLAEDMLMDLASLLGIDAARMNLGFGYFNSEADTTLPDVAEFEPIGKSAQRKTHRPPQTDAQKLAAFPRAVGLLAHDFEAVLKEMLAGQPPGIADPERLGRKMRAQFDRTARDLLQDMPGNLPSFEELIAARDNSPEALAELLASRAPAYLTPIALCTVQLGPPRFMAALLKHGVDPNTRNAQGQMLIESAQDRPEMYRVFKTPAAQ